MLISSRQYYGDEERRLVREKIVWRMIRWINNIQAHWGLPYAYRPGRLCSSGGSGGGGGGDA